MTDAAVLAVELARSAAALFADRYDHLTSADVLAATAACMGRQVDMAAAVVDIDDLCNRLERVRAAAHG